MIAPRQLVVTDEAHVVPHAFYLEALKRVTASLERDTEIVSVKRRTWRTLWLVKRTFRERRLKPTRVIQLATTAYDPEAPYDYSGIRS